MKISEVIKAIKEGKQVYCNNRRLSFYRDKFWSSTIASEKSYSLSGIRNYIKQNIDTLEIA